MTAARTLARPSGQPPPRRAELPGGTSLDVEALATEVARRYLARYPDERERYGDAGADWCVHDNQHLLNWAALELSGFGPMDADVRWLAGVLDARGFPLDRLADDLYIAADVASEQEDAAGLAVPLRRSARMVRDEAGAPPDPEPAG